MDASTVATVALVCVMLAVFGGYIYHLVAGVREERRDYAAIHGRPRRHTWKDTLAILVGLTAIGWLAATGRSDKEIIQVVMGAIAAWYLFRSWRTRRAIKQAEHDARTYRPYEGI